MIALANLMIELLNTFIRFCSILQMGLNAFISMDQLIKKSSTFSVTG